MNKIKRRKKPKFRRQDATSYKRIKKNWRRPKGSQSKKRKKELGKGVKPDPGYGSPKKIKYLHPSGFKEVLISNLKDLDGIDPKVYACRISSKIGKKKAIEIMKKATESNLKVLNPKAQKKEA